MTSLRSTSRLAAGVGIAAAAVLLLAGPAAADTSQARAKAARVALLSAPIVDTGEVTASNAGGGETKSGPTSTTVLGGQTLVTAGVLAQDATARDDGTSAACAGALGAGGAIQIGLSGTCTATIGTPDGITVALTPGVITVGADAIYAECTASSTGAPTGRATLADANIFFLLAAPVTLTAAPAPNQGVNVPGIASLILNEQIPLAGGGLTVNALHISLLANPATGQAAADIIIGSVTCGPNAVAPPISIFAGPALPASAAGAIAVGATFFIRRRRRQAA